jgi:hypothetical protein
VFLQDHPQTVWVTTVAECLSRLHETWDEVHLDHDLGGQTYVDSRAEDCGMEVIRWLCKEPRPHLEATRFFVHTHNAAAGLLMVLQMRSCGYDGEFRPFGVDLALVLAQNEPAPTSDPPPSPGSPLRRFSRWMSWEHICGLFLRRRDTELSPGADRPGRGNRDPGMP